MHYQMVLVSNPQPPRERFFPAHTLSTRRESRPDKIGASLYVGPEKVWTSDDDKILILKLSMLRLNSREEVHMTKISKSWCVIQFFFELICFDGVI